MSHTRFHEPILHRTGALPLAFYHVDEQFPRYHMTMHWHEETELIRVLEGRFLLFTDDAEYAAGPGDLITIGPGMVHGGEPDRCIYECIVFDLKAMTPAGDLSSAVCTPFLHRTMYVKNCEIESIPGFRSAIDELFMLTAGALSGREALLAADVCRLAYFLSAAPAYVRNPDSGGAVLQRAERLKPALEYMESEYGHRITLEELARLSGFSPKYFCRYFRSVAHRSPIEYLNYFRIEKASQFLTEEDASIADVAVRCGFADSSAFIKQFRRLKGETPKQYQLSRRAQSTGYTRT